MQSGHTRHVPPSRRRFEPGNNRRRPAKPAGAWRSALEGGRGKERGRRWTQAKGRGLAAARPPWCCRCCCCCSVEGPRAGTGAIGRRSSPAFLPLRLLRSCPPAPSSAWALLAVVGWAALAQWPAGGSPPAGTRRADASEPGQSPAATPHRPLATAPRRPSRAAAASSSCQVPAGEICGSRQRRDCR